ncbi:MAG TPA: galactokinase [Candidatus Hydrogenedentes bacterium]|nr:galactokinase [Candidatus Hydrogenedentota bacterium]
MGVDLNQAKRWYAEHFGAPPELCVRAPGRVNIIGEHTDYNHGFVLPMAIEQATYILARPREDRMLKAFAANLEQTAQADLVKRHRAPESPWLDYIVGVAEELAKLDRPLAGADLMIVGDVPIGCGLSSSASLEMAALKLFECLGAFEMEGPEAAELGRRVENDFLGLSSGIMDQFISRMARAGHALFLDCRSYQREQVPVAFPSAAFVIANTGVTRGLTASKYNERVDECNEAVRAMATQNQTHLRDFTLDHLEAARQHMPANVYRRARHVITEDERTRAACEAMRAGDPERLGELMDASDASLRDDYEVTCPELDAMTAIARQAPGCYGARMTGAGFGGCTINLVENEHVPAFVDHLLRAYPAQTGTAGQAFISRPADGAGTVPL